MRIIATALLLVAIGLAGGLIVVESGLVNVAASEPELALERWLLSTAMERAVRRRAQDVVVPASLESGEQVRAGFAAYEAMCEGCHSAPGVDPDVVGQGLNPRPPELDDAAREWSPAELFWITKHGIRMTGMPAFGATHEDAELWNLVAFLSRLSELSPEDYRRMRGLKDGAEATPTTHQHGGRSHPH